MSTAPDNFARINVRLPSDLKDEIEQAACSLGQSVTDFTVASAVREARRVLHESSVTKLSNRDRDLFLAALSAKKSTPNAKLKAAAEKYKKRLG